MAPRKSSFLGPPLLWAEPGRKKAHHVSHARPQTVTLRPGMLQQGLDKGGVGPYGILDVGHQLHAVLANVPTSLQRRGG